MTAESSRGADEVEAFEYPACSGAAPLPAWNGWVEAADAGDKAGEGSQGGMRNPAHGALDESLTKDAQQSFAAGRERGLEQGRQAEREAQAELLAAEQSRHKQQLAALVARFSAESDRFLRTVEQEVVKLALAIAARILRREAQMDPLLLTGAVRVALGQLAASSEVRLRVPRAEVDLWTETIAIVPNLALKPTVVAGEGMRLSDCVIESKAGTVDLGVRSQLAEIERGFFDRAGTSHAGEASPNAHANGAVPSAAGDEARV
jgi:flagellar assembly protein FliH